MNLFIDTDERVHFSFKFLNIIGDTGMDLIFAPALEWSKSELEYIQESLVKMLPIIGNDTEIEFFIYKEIEGYPKTFVSKKYIGVNGVFEIIQEFTFKDKE